MRKPIIPPPDARRKLSKAYKWWAASGLAAPILFAMLRHTIEPDPLSGFDSALYYLNLMLCPAVIVIAPEDTWGIAGLIIWAIYLLINAFLYLLIGTTFERARRGYKLLAVVPILVIANYWLFILTNA